MKLSKTKSRLTQSAFFEVVFRPFKQGTVQSFNGQQSFVKSNCEHSCCTVNSRRKGKIHFAVPFLQSSFTLHYTAKKTIREVLHMQEMFSFNTMQFKLLPQKCFSKSTCKLLKIDQVSCRSVSKSCYRVQVFGTLRENHLTPVTQRCRQASAKYCRPPRLFC